MDKDGQIIGEIHTERKESFPVNQVSHIIEKTIFNNAPPNLDKYFPYPNLITKNMLYYY